MVNLQHVSRILIMPQAFTKLRGFIEECKAEISGFGTAEITHNGILIRDIFILEQEISYGRTEISEEEIARFLIRLLDEGKDPSAIKVWWHSHGGMDVFWSETDIKSMASCFLSDFMVTVVGNKQGRFKARVNIYKPATRVIDDLSLVLQFPADVDPGLQDEVRAEIAKKVKFIPVPSLRREDLSDSSVDQDMTASFWGE